MATFNCADCGGLVSTSAKACPHCGARRKAKLWVRIPLWIVSVFAIVIMFDLLTSPKSRLLLGYKLQDIFQGSIWKN